ncbi:periplasmic protein [Pseudoalteromonas sp. THAF3]|uniref:Spy/CpxP family protein refolding chaperone n=1 Tax=Pseudoalteromonas sp. THAF3 TaxID=2587843 RepID=UPI001267FEDF|nr:Spy/CpxP family protein refolding chaperone [Pseudoalteromonas sp. THAF3]QFU03874.1 periplasmic protein [Pseudoalteromonas sp. THAF3]
MKLGKSISATLLSLALASSAVFAGQGAHHNHGERGMFNKRMANYLQLSEQQQSQIEAILDAQKQLQPQRDQRGDMKQQLNALTHTNASFDEQAARALIQEQQAKQLERKVARLHTQHQIWNLLTEQQQQKLQELKEKRQSRGHHKRDH